MGELINEESILNTNISSDSQGRKSNCEVNVSANTSENTPDMLPEHLDNTKYLYEGHDVDEHEQHMDKSLPGRKRSLSRISEASHTSTGMIADHDHTWSHSDLDHCGTQRKGVALYSATTDQNGIVQHLRMPDLKAFGSSVEPWQDSIHARPGGGEDSVGVDILRRERGRVPGVRDVSAGVVASCGVRMSTTYAREPNVSLAGTASPDTPQCRAVIVADGDVSTASSGQSPTQAVPSAELIVAPLGAAPPTPIRVIPSATTTPDVAPAAPATLKAPPAVSIPETASLSTAGPRNKLGGRRSNLKRKTSLPILDVGPFNRGYVSAPPTPPASAGASIWKKSISFSDKVEIGGGWRKLSEPTLYHDLGKPTSGTVRVATCQRLQRSERSQGVPSTQTSPPPSYTASCREGSEEKEGRNAGRERGSDGAVTVGQVEGGQRDGKGLQVIRPDPTQQGPGGPTIKLKMNSEADGSANTAGMDGGQRTSSDRSLESSHTLLSGENTAVANDAPNDNGVISGSFYMADDEDGLTSLAYNDDSSRTAQNIPDRASDVTLSSISRTTNREFVTSSKSMLTRQEFSVSDDVFRLSETTTKDTGEESEPKEFFPEALKNSLVVILSGLYGMLLVVLGLVLPISETFSKNDQFMFEIYYIYLYIVSMVFLLYVHCYLLRRQKFEILWIPKSITRTFSRNFSRTSVQRATSRRMSQDVAGSSTRNKQAPPNPQSEQLLIRRNSTVSSASGRGRRKKIAYNAKTSHHTGSFYLRVGVIGFGIGSMIHSGLTFGHYFEVNHLGNPCSDIIQAIKPFCHLCFTFVQMYFVFMNSKMCIHKYTTLARFGLMHMSGTNICVWLRSIVVETLHVIKIEERKIYDMMMQAYLNTQDVQDNGGLQTTNASQASSLDPEQAFNGHGLGSLPELNCHWDAMMGKVVEQSSVYLYPCTIEYSLVCACVLYVMWSNVGEDTKTQRSRAVEVVDSVSEFEEDDDRTHKMSVDCAGSSRGLFLGIFLFVISVVCLISFYVLISTSNDMTTGSLLGHISEDVIYMVALIATTVGAYKMRGMHFSVHREAGIEEILTLISLCGLGLFGMFSIVASMFYLDSLNGLLTILTNILMLVQAGAQATFTLAALRVSAVDSTQVREKPGRQYVTFLLISNFALWAMNTFETQRQEHNIIQVEFYGATAWSIFSHISVPLGIYFRFHSTVSLSTVWKKAWKLKHVQGNGGTSRHNGFDEQH